MFQVIDRHLNCLIDKPDLVIVTFQKQEIRKNSLASIRGLVQNKGNTIIQIKSKIKNEDILWMMI